MANTRSGTIKMLREVNALQSQVAELRSQLEAAGVDISNNLIGNIIYYIISNYWESVGYYWKIESITFL